ncbi:DNA-binding transcriptional regulator YhcF (GntR family) [Nocardiopsis mwathae]|uniref:DNA-binding transcriptional regulator YhcF (GntR family) n=1 Tax=Nocardiopsis mwathae TaxID=1472723 RepID=A0A7X0D916_9ACTN|nr:GntR family transcriptional regulator [Nocardiopsis mwathae]MBB6174589.1 DNA-binding transcriptional regulator YhcF (GntR family) [Nocardiopsis mwathae]
MFDDRSPIYVQIAERIAADVLSGVLREGEKIPSTNEYAAFFQINPATAAKGIGRLVDEGVLFKKRGIGMFVSPGARDELRARRREVFFSEVVDPMVDSARAIGLPLGAVVDRIRQHMREED